MSGNIWMFSDEIDDEEDFRWGRIIGISKSRLTENIEKRIIIIRGGISHDNACVGGVDNGSNEGLCCSSG